MPSRPATDSTALVWFRRDLRLHDHPPLVRALAEHARVVPVFVLDPAILCGRFASAPRTAFMLDCLRELDADLRQRGSGLVVRQGRSERELVALARQAGAAAVLWAGDATPYALARDRRVREALGAVGVAAVPGPGTFVADVGRPRTSAGRPFTVFTPFQRAWQQLERRPVHRAPGELPPLPADVVTGRLPGVGALVGRDPLRERAVAPGEAAARRAAARWLDGHLGDYARDHDRLAGGASQLSAYLRFGCLSARELEQRALRRGGVGEGGGGGSRAGGEGVDGEDAAGERAAGEDAAGEDAAGAGAAAFVRQLAWRDFYAHVLLHHPANLRREHQRRMRSLDLDRDDELLSAWQEGRTGYPLVDAGMRQLRASGWMHNRARLVVGSFLTKDLQLDWRAGEAWFMRWLLDGDVASNNGNWQWIASVGVDPAPAFRRILNPTLQQRRHDPDGVYVRRWVPELARVPDDRLAEPWRMSEAEQRAAGCRIGRDYPEPIVDHGAERRRALERYRAAATRDGPAPEAASGS